MTSTFHPQDLIGREVVDPDGEKIGKVGAIYVTDDSGQPEWATVKTGLLGNGEHFVPLGGSALADDDLQVTVSKEKVKDAPKMGADGHLSHHESVDLYSYYGMRAPSAAAESRQQDGEEPKRTRSASQDLGERTGETATMGGTAGAAAGGAAAAQGSHVRLRKYVVTEEKQITVQVSHDEVRVERVPASEARNSRS